MNDIVCAVVFNPLDSSELKYNRLINSGLLSFKPKSKTLFPHKHTPTDFTEQPPAKTFGVAGVDVRITCKTNYAKDQGINVDVVWLVNDGSEPDVDGEKVINRV